MNPDFANFIPGNASLVIHANSLTNLYLTTTNFLDSLNAGSDSHAPSAQVKQVLSMFGIDLQRDLLSWMTGDYALFFRADMLDLVSAAVTNTTPNLENLDQKFDFGLVVEATDPDKARAFAARLDTLIQQMVAGQQGITVSSETIHGVDVTVLSLSAPLDARNTLNIDLLIGASDDVFFLATRPAAETILNGDGMLTGNRSYIEAQNYVLPNPTTVVYADGEGLVLGAAVPTIGAAGAARAGDRQRFHQYCHRTERGRRSRGNPHPLADSNADADG